MTLPSLHAAAEEHPDRPALVFPERTWTFAALYDEVAAPAEELADRFARDGLPLVLTGERSPSTLLRLHAAIEARVPLYLVHPRWTDADRARALGRSGADRADLRGSDVLAFVHTSGSTGVPKAIALSRRAFAASAAASAANLPWRADDRWLLAMTPAHIGGLSIVTRCLAGRTTVVVAPPGRFEPAALLDLIDAHAVTLVSLVPTMLTRLLGAMERRGAPPSLRAALVGGAPVGEALVARAAAAGLTALPTYGMTEACSQVATRSPSGGGARPLPGVRVEVRDGEIHVGGPTLYSGILEGGVVRAPMLRDGLHPTGDLGALRDGALEVVGRADDRIITGGENVDPAEVEDALASLPGVSGAVVFGEPDPDWGEVVSAAVTVEGGASPDALRAALAGEVAGFRVPRRWHVVDELPTTASGKIDRRAVIAALRDPDGTSKA